MGAAIAAAQIARVLLSLGVVFAIMGIAVKILRRRGVGMVSRSGRTRAAEVEVVARYGLNRSAAVALVRVGERYLVIGIGDSSVALLAEGDRAAFGIAAQGEHETQRDEEATRTAPLRGRSPDQAWRMLLATMRDRTVRRG